MYVSEICAEGIFVTFPWWLKNVKSRPKIALFSNERHFEIWFPKKRTITFFWSKLSKLHKKDPILHVATTFSLKQGETRTSHGPIPHPLIMEGRACACIRLNVMFIFDKPLSFCFVFVSVCLCFPNVSNTNNSAVLVHKACAIQAAFWCYPILPSYSTIPFAFPSVRKLSPLKWLDSFGQFWCQ